MNGCFGSNPNGQQGKENGLSLAFETAFYQKSQQEYRKIKRLSGNCRVSPRIWGYECAHAHSYPQMQPSSRRFLETRSNSVCPDQQHQALTTGNSNKIGHLVFDLLWSGIAYGLVDALLLTVLPVLAPGRHLPCWIGQPIGPVNFKLEQALSSPASW
jgi:hypothetical protein